MEEGRGQASRKEGDASVRRMERGLARWRQRVAVAYASGLGVIVCLTATGRVAQLSMLGLAGLFVFLALWIVGCVAISWHYQNLCFELEDLQARVSWFPDDD